MHLTALKLTLLAKLIVLSDIKLPSEIAERLPANKLGAYRFARKLLVLSHVVVL